MLLFGKGTVRFRWESPPFPNKSFKYLLLNIQIIDKFISKTFFAPHGNSGGFNSILLLCPCDYVNQRKSIQFSIPPAP
ncbi:unnamed protein product [Hymenolepis diminuta]|uniref:Uncharacterized protein n=1 Tax=Hymenolepis diminuta TaxID=6216 RepID=A0A564XZM1_HYMDI|nr:unnamed protein product [Hymenolepis diminuta]